MDKPKFIMLVGLPGSGKSFGVKQIAGSSGRNTFISTFFFTAVPP